MKVGLLIRWLVEINFQCGTDWSRHLVSGNTPIKFGKEVSSSAHQEVLLEKVHRKKEALLTEVCRRVRERG